MFNDLGVTIVICCFNSAERLPRTLKCILNQQNDQDISWEVIVVDNNSTDDTSKIAQVFWNANQTSVSLKVVAEPNPGLHNARMKGVLTAKYETILFCDDDNWLNNSYMQTAYEIMCNKPMIGALGGKGNAVADVDLPEWFEEKKHAFAVGNQANYSGDVTSRGFIWGAGMVIRKSVFMSLVNSGFRFYCSGRKQNEILAGDDSEICKWLILGGYFLWYDERLVFDHYIEKRRLSKDYLNNLFAGFEKSHEFLNIYDKVIARSKLEYTLKFKIYSTSKLMLKLIVNNIFFGKNSSEILSRLQFINPASKIFREDELFYNIYKAYLNFKKK